MREFGGIATFKIHKLQKRRIKSCVSCQEKKRKCSREVPACRFCQQKNIQCVYNAKSPKAGNRSTSITASLKSDLAGEKSSPLFDETVGTADIFNHIIQQCEDSHSVQPQAFNWVQNLHPENRIGPVFSPMFNPSLNLPDAKTLLDFNLLASFVPKKNEADILISRFRSSVHPLIPVLDWQSLYPLYSNYWNDDNNRNIEFYIILFSIFYAASVSLFEESSVLQSNDNFDKVELVKKMKYYIGATECALAMSGYPKRVTITGLQASIIMYSVTRNDCRTDDFLSISSLIRCAQLIELNRDPKEYHNIKDPKEIQIRRVLWLQIFYLDCISALSSRLSPILSECEYDTQLPDEYRKHYSSDLILDQAIAFATGRFKWSLCTNKILKAFYGIKPKSSQLVGKILRDVENLSFYCSSVIQRMVDPINVIPGEEIFIQFATLNLSSLANKCLVLIDNLFGNEFKESKSSQKKLVYFQRKNVSTSSISDSGDKDLDDEAYLKHMQVLNGCISYGEMPKFALFTWDIRKYQPIHTFLIMLRKIIYHYHHLKNQDYSLDEIKVKLREDFAVKIIDNSLTKLDYLSEHTTPLCRKRWKLVKNLKCLIWDGLIKQKAENYIDRIVQSNDDILTNLKELGENFTNSKTTVDNQTETPISLTQSENEIDFSSDSNQNIFFSGSVCLQHTGQLDESFVDESLEGLFNKLENVIDENMNFKVWDDLSGHYLD